MSSESAEAVTTMLLCNFPCSCKWSPWMPEDPLVLRLRGTFIDALPIDWINTRGSRSHSVPARLGAGTGLEDADAQQYVFTLIESTMRLPEDKHIGIDETLQQTATIMRRTNTLIHVLQELSLNYLMILRKAVS